MNWLRRALSPTLKPSPVALNLDFHCHLIPGVDDGVRDTAESLAAIAGLMALGYKGAITTPHIYPGLFDNTEEGLTAAYQAFLPHVPSGFTLHLAAEYFAGDALIERLERGDALLSIPIQGQNAVLVEFPYTNPPSHGFDALLALRARGYQPILAHPERYRYLCAEPQKWLGPLQKLDVWLQCDIGSLSGQYGEKPAAMALWFLERSMPTLWGSDLHRPHHIAEHIQPGLVRMAQAQYGQKSLLNAILTAAKVAPAAGEGPL